MIKLTDFIANFLVDAGVRDVFMLTGGGAMHLNDSFGKHPNLKVTFNHHEQASAMAAESYARLSNKIAVVNVTTGPGGLNTLNGVFGAWTDSIPMLVISGQVKYETTIQGSGLPLRQMGDQEYDIVKSVQPMTKYAVMMTDPNEIKYHLQKALYLATKGRPGPVWLDIPMNVQAATIDENNLPEYDFADTMQQPQKTSNEVIEQILEKIQHAKRPVILAGTGVRLSGAYNIFLQLVDTLKIPVVTAFNAHDLLDEEHPYYFGRAGTVGDRAGNFVVQNSDLLLVFGCRLNIRQVSYNWNSFARAAYKIIVDIDAVELKKPTVKADLPVHADLANFMQQLMSIAENRPLEKKRWWLNWCAERKNRYPVVLKEYWERKELVNPYCFIAALGKHLPEGQITVTANATACITAFQALPIKKNQRLYSNSGSASMGYDLPAAIGAYIASKEKIVCLAGDGSIQQNIQELATISFNQYPIKIFVLSNDGYHSIRQTQTSYFGQQLVGVGPGSGLGLPNFEKLAYAYDISYVRCENHASLDEAITDTLRGDKPVICEIMLTSEQPFAPKLSSRKLADGRMVSSPLEDLAPFLDREEFAENMLIELLREV